MDSNFQALFSHLTHDQVKAVLQDLWRKNDEKQHELDKIRKENDKNKNELDKIRREKYQKSLKIMTMGKAIDALTNKIEVLQMSKASANLSCPVCLENFDSEDHRAYVLNCPHMICSKCLHPALQPDVNLLVYKRTRTSGLISRQATNSERRNNRHIIHDENHPSKRCPICREPVTTKLRKIFLNKGQC